MQKNTQLELAENLLKYTGTHLFLTGKAGTGKTTFLHNLRKQSSKRMVVVAPTGVAAINAGGVTIHSFFQLGFAPFIPGTKMTKDFFRFSKEKANIIRSLDLLVIDEISMVRADLLDAVDYVLRHFRKKNEPFGGVQLLMIGDLQQLAPVLKDNERALLREHYPSPFFFNSLALKQTPYLCVELKTVYRQSDQTFVDMLNRIRENNADATTLQELNKRYIPGFNPPQEEGYITLTTHNAQAQYINNNKLNNLHSEKFIYKARITGNFPEYSYPTDAELELKEGAQVMFVKNDSSPEKRYYNGKIATITTINENKIEVKGKDDSHPIVVEKSRWSNVKYIIDPQTKELKEEEEGAFEQYPLKTAWAITVHKSQGLTFEKAIIDANASFAHGQVYVALSRCKTLDGLVLSSPISPQSVIRDRDIDSYITSTKEREPNEKRFADLRKEYHSKMLFEQFTYTDLQQALSVMRRFLDEHFSTLYPELLSRYKQAELNFQQEIMHVSTQFQSQMQQLLSASENPEEDAFLNERVKKAACYFFEKINNLSQNLVEKTIIETDNRETRKKVKEIFSSLQTEVRRKQKTLEVCRDGFSVLSYLNIKSKASMQDEKEKTGKSGKSKTEKGPKITTSGDILHPELYEQLRDWRYMLAQEQNIPVYMVLPQTALLGIANFLPQDTNQLLQISGIGKATKERYGEEILEIVKQCVQDYGYEVKEQLLAYETASVKEKMPKGKTQEES